MPGTMFRPNIILFTYKICIVIKYTVLKGKCHLYKVWQVKYRWTAMNVKNNSWKFGKDRSFLCLVNGAFKDHQILPKEQLLARKWVCLSLDTGHVINVVQSTASWRHPRGGALWSLSERREIPVACGERWGFLLELSEGHCEAQMGRRYLKLSENNTEMQIFALGRK